MCYKVLVEREIKEFGKFSELDKLQLTTKIFSIQRGRGLGVRLAYEGGDFVRYVICGAK
jgi:hypothetical protein